MTQFLLALALFLALHMVPAIPALRAKLVATMGRRAYLVVYSLVSLLTLAWLFHAALQLDFVPLWDPAPWQAWFPLVLTPIALVLLLAGLTSPNPASITLRKPDLKPGAITTVTRHPVLWGFALWAGSHLVPNGDLRSLLLFGALLAFALLGMVITDRRSRRLGAQWAEIARTTSILPLAAVLAGRTKLRFDGTLGMAIFIAAALTAWLLLGGHEVLFGADPLTMAAA
ncbi:NnrU family protein [Devosia ginsengisoli]|uniref:NnrU family protein n=1 Tax=Devosia ginsengisoli TaxID=400770 RepID=UPI0026ECF6C3|nr:NnrU family protein [Devosia ginsengisoli]MCR6670579.1 NnrU family protein [Devosia ginsengisoli]